MRMVLHPQKKNVKKNTRAQGKKVKFFSPPQSSLFNQKMSICYIFSGLFKTKQKKNYFTVYPTNGVMGTNPSSFYNVFNTAQLF